MTCEKSSYIKTTPIEEKKDEEPNEHQKARLKTKGHKEEKKEVNSKNQKLYQPNPRKKKQKKKRKSLALVTPDKFHDHNQTKVITPLKQGHE